MQPCATERHEGVFGYDHIRSRESLTFILESGEVAIAGRRST